MRTGRHFGAASSTSRARSETRYVYDGMLLVQERIGAGHPAVTYTRGLDLGSAGAPPARAGAPAGSFEGAGGIGGLLARTAHGSTSPYQPSTSAYYHADGNGNVAYLLNQDRSHGASYKYDPYGRLIASSGGLAAANLMRFSSKLWHDHSETYYYGYRFYLPEAQRWINRDPILEEGGINLYGFVGNSPLDYVDTLGLSTDTYVPDNHKHGGPHIDRYDKHGNNVGRYRPDGSSIDQFGRPAPRIPKSDLEKFMKAVKKLMKKGCWMLPYYLELLNQGAGGGPQHSGNGGVA